VHAGLRKHLLNKILPGLFQKYKARFSRNDFYMVVVGGMSVERCANLSRASSRFLRDIFSEDIDIKCVFKKKVHTVDDESIQRVHEVRMDFLSDVVSEMKVHIGKMRFDEGVQVQVEIDDSLLASTLDKIQSIKVVGINIHYIEHQRRFETPILDTSLYTSVAPAHFEKFRSITHGKLPIPVSVNNGVAFATCDYCYYDTVRMFLDRIEYFKEKKSVFALMKFYRNVVKFMSLYVLRHKIKNLPDKLHKIYSEVHSALMKLDLIRIKKGFRRELSAAKYDEEFVSKIVNIMRDVLEAVDVEDIIRTTVKEIQLKYIDRGS